MTTLAPAAAVVKPAAAPSATVKLGYQDYDAFDAWRTQPSFAQRQAAERARIEAQYDAWVDAHADEMEAQSEVDEWESQYSQMVSPW